MKSKLVNVMLLSTKNAHSSTASHSSDYVAEFSTLGFIFCVFLHDHIISASSLCLFFFFDITVLVDSQLKGKTDYFAC